ncbi:hypothetical protein QTP88_027137 [Uroleucon formosanum]
MGELRNRRKDEIGRRFSKDNDFKRNLPASQRHLILNGGQVDSTSIAGQGVDLTKGSRSKKKASVVKLKRIIDLKGESPTKYQLPIGGSWTIEKQTLLYGNYIHRNKKDHHSRFSCRSVRLCFPLLSYRSYYLYYHIVCVINYLYMSSSSGGDSRAGKSPAPNKIKLSSSANRASDTNYKVVVSRKNARKSNSNLPIPTSPGLQQIYNNTPILNASQSVFVLNNSISTDNNVSADLITNDGLSTDNLNDPTSSSVPVVISTLMNTPTYTTDISNDINMSSQRTQQTFSADYNGPVIILVECIDMNKHIGNWHPFKAAKFFSTNFSGITNIKPAGSKKIKISFDSTSNGNLCLTSDVLFDHGFTANIPSNLIYSFGIIKLDPDVSEDDFRDGVHSIFPIVNFKRISIKKDGNIVPTRIVELKFLSPKLPQHISVYNLIFDVNPSIRSPVQCNRCLRYGHTQKFCRSDPRCSHCGGSKHSILECPTASSTDPTCIFCKLPHAATDRSCQEWSVQKDIKKIMATENISYKDALEFKKNKYYTSAFKYTDVVNSQLPDCNTLISSNPLSEDNFPILNESHHFFNSRKPKQKPRTTSNRNRNVTLAESSYSPPNGSYLNNLSNQHTALEKNSNDFSWVHALSLKLSETLINSPSLSSPFSSSSLQSLIESSLISLLAIPNFKNVS